MDYIVGQVNRDAEKNGSKVRIEGHDENWWRTRFAGADDPLRSILSKKDFCPDMDEQAIEERVQEQKKASEQIFGRIQKEKPK